MAIAVSVVRAATIFVVVVKIMATVVWLMTKINPWQDAKEILVHLIHVHVKQYSFTELEQRLKCTQDRVRNWLETTERAIDFATYAHGNFIKGNYETKKVILLALGSNFILKDSKLKIEDAE